MVEIIDHRKGIEMIFFMRPWSVGSWKGGFITSPVGWSKIKKNVLRILAMHAPKRN